MPDKYLIIDSIGEPVSSCDKDENLNDACRDGLEDVACGEVFIYKLYGQAEASEIKITLAENLNKEDKDDDKN